MTGSLQQAIKLPFIKLVDGSFFTLKQYKKIPEHALLRDRLAFDSINRTTEQHSPEEAEEYQA